MKTGFKHFHAYQPAKKEITSSVPVINDVLYYWHYWQGVQESELYKRKFYPLTRNSGKENELSVQEVI